MKTNAFFNIFKTKTSMLDYFKTILEKVSFDSHLFEKELRKGIGELLNDDLQEFKRWCYENFGASHSQILNQCFA